MHFRKWVLPFVSFTVFSSVGAPKDPLRWPNPHRFEYFWNVPTHNCTVHEGAVLSYMWWVFGFQQNANGSFLGDKINLLYSPGAFPRVILPDTVINGGLPQAGSLEEHLKEFEKDVVRAIPDPQYDKLAVISFHDWRPLWSLNGWYPRKMYKSLSWAYEREMYPNVTDFEDINNNSVKAFEASAKKYFIETLKKAKIIRPRALWGFDSYPICFNARGEVKDYNCKKVATDANDKLVDIYSESKALYSAAYLDHYVGPRGPERRYGRKKVIVNRVREAMRFMSYTNRTYLYIRMYYNDVNQLMDKDDFNDFFETACFYGMSGIIIWEKSENANTKQKCKSIIDTLTKNLSDAMRNLDPCHKSRLQLNVYQQFGRRKPRPYK